MGTISLFWILFVTHKISKVTGIECGYPGSPAYGRPHPVRETYRPGDAVSFTCIGGYTLQGHVQRVCAPNGTWIGAIPLCDRGLNSIDHIATSRNTLSLYPANKSIDGDSRSCTYTDKLPPRWIRVDLRETQKIRAVSITVPAGIYAQDPAHLTIYAINVRDATTASYHKCASFTGQFSATTLKLTCAGGEVVGRYIHVEDNRRRIDYFSLCEIQVYVNKGTYECGEAERPAYSYSVRTESGSVDYRCIYGYQLEGPSTRFCMSNGQWSLRQPICHEIICPHIYEVSHGRMYYTGRKNDLSVLGTTVNVTCDYGYRISGSPLICQEDGTWSGDELACQPIDCGTPPTRYDSEQITLLNGTGYGGVALVTCVDDSESFISCREDGIWSTPDNECIDNKIVSKLGLIEEGLVDTDIPTGIVIGMGVVVFILIILVVFVLLMKRRKVLRQNSTDSIPSKETGSIDPSAPQPYDNDAFYDTIPVDAADSNTDFKKKFLSTILFTRKKSIEKNPEDKPNPSTTQNGCIYEEINRQPALSSSPQQTTGSADENKQQPVYAQVDLEEKRRCRATKSSNFPSLDPPSWENTYRSEEAPSFDDDIDLEPIKLRELPPLPKEGRQGVIYATLNLKSDPELDKKRTTNDAHKDKTDSGAAALPKEKNILKSMGILKM